MPLETIKTKQNICTISKEGIYELTNNVQLLKFQSEKLAVPGERARITYSFYNTRIHHKKGNGNSYGYLFILVLQESLAKTEKKG